MAAPGAATQGKIVVEVEAKVRLVGTERRPFVSVHVVDGTRVSDLAISRMPGDELARMTVTRARLNRISDQSIMGRSTLSNTHGLDKKQDQDQDQDTDAAEQETAQIVRGSRIVRHTYRAEIPFDAPGEHTLLCVQLYCELLNHREEVCFHHCGYANVLLAKLFTDGSAQSVVVVGLRDNGRWATNSWSGADACVDGERGQVALRMVASPPSFATRQGPDPVLPTTDVAKLKSVVTRDMWSHNDAASRIVPISHDIRPLFMPPYASRGFVLPIAAFLRIGRPNTGPDVVPYASCEEYYINALRIAARRRLYWTRVRSGSKLPPPSLDDTSVREFIDAALGRTIQRLTAAASTTKYGDTVDMGAALLMDTATLFCSSCPYLYDKQLSSTGTMLEAADEFVGDMMTLRCGDCEDDSKTIAVVIGAITSGARLGRWQSILMYWLAAVRARYVAVLVLKMVSDASGPAAHDSVSALGGSMFRDSAPHACLDLVPFGHFVDAVRRASQLSADPQSATSNALLAHLGSERVLGWRTALCAKFLAQAGHGVSSSYSGTVYGAKETLVIVGEGTGIVPTVEPGETVPHSIRRTIRNILDTADIPGARIITRDNLALPDGSKFYRHATSITIVDDDIVGENINFSEACILSAPSPYRLTSTPSIRYKHSDVGDLQLGALHHVYANCTAWEASGLALLAMPKVTAEIDMRTIDMLSAPDVPIPRVYYSQTPPGDTAAHQDAVRMLSAQLESIGSALPDTHSRLSCIPVTACVQALYITSDVVDKLRYNVSRSDICGFTVCVDQIALGLTIFTLTFLVPSAP